MRDLRSRSGPFLRHTRVSYPNPEMNSSCRLVLIKFRTRWITGSAGPDLRAQRTLIPINTLGVCTWNLPGFSPFGREILILCTATGFRHQLATNCHKNNSGKYLFVVKLFMDKPWLISWGDTGNNSISVGPNGVNNNNVNSYLFQVAYEWKGVS